MDHHCVGCQINHEAVVWLFRESGHARQYICLERYLRLPSEDRCLWDRNLSFITAGPDSSVNH